MKLFKKFLFLVFFLILSINPLKALEKVSYIDIDYILANTLAGKSLLTKLKKDEELKINKFKSREDDFRNEENKILAKKNLISKEEVSKELKLLQIKVKEYRKDKIKEIDELKDRRNKNIINFMNLINPIIEKYMSDNSIYMVIDKKNIFIASKDYDITNNLIELIDNQIKTIKIN
tara:strand:+ start:146 stop:673 length:528 start_codon:yes stop_codon:yes gene_type:complete